MQRTHALQVQRAVDGDGSADDRRIESQCGARIHLDQAGIADVDQDIELASDKLNNTGHRVGDLALTCEVAALGKRQLSRVCQLARAEDLRQAPDTDHSEILDD